MSQVAMGPVGACSISPSPVHVIHLNFEIRILAGHMRNILGKFTWSPVWPVTVLRLLVLVIVISIVILLLFFFSIVHLVWRHHYDLWRRRCESLRQSIVISNVQWVIMWNKKLTSSSSSAGRFCIEDLCAFCLAGGCAFIGGTTGGLSFFISVTSSSCSFHKRDLSSRILV